MPWQRAEDMTLPLSGQLKFCLNKNIMDNNYIRNNLTVKQMKNETRKLHFQTLVIFRTLETNLQFKI